MDHEQPSQELLAKISSLTESQKKWLFSFVQQFGMPHKFWRNEDSDLVSDTVLENIGDLLRIHHAMSRRALSKAPFEYAFEKALQLSGISAELADSSTNPGYDLVAANKRISLKTEAAKNISKNKIHVSKWMEMGTGDWDPPNIQLPLFFKHLENYDRIFTFRCLVQESTKYSYELVEIPKDLMLEAEKGSMEKAESTEQPTFPWYCRVAAEEAKDDSQKKKYKFSLYFDAGGERKLQVKSVDKKYCIVHATWTFESSQLVKEESEGGGAE